MNNQHNTYEGVEHRTPIDYLEPEDEEQNQYREASLAFLRIISLALSFILESEHPQTAAYGVAFALGLTSVLGEKSMRQIGRETGLSSATISNNAKRFSRYADLPPSPLMKSLEQCEQSKENRNNYCQ
jgi:hypothetical protein